MQTLRLPSVRPSQRQHLHFALFWLLFLPLAAVVLRNLSRGYPQIAQYPYYEANLVVLRVLTWLGLLAAALWSARLGLTGQRWLQQVVPALCGLVLATFMALFLAGADGPFMGAEGDNRYVLSAVNKMTFYNTFWVDFYYRDLPPHYPPLIFYLTSLVQRAAGVEGLLAIKIVLLATALMAPWLTVTLWRLVLGHSPYLWALAFQPFLYVDYHKPGSWLAILLLVPWWLYYVENLHRRAFGWRDYLVGGLIGGLIVHLQYFFMLIPITGYFLTLPWRWRGRYPFDKGYRFSDDFVHKAKLAAVAFVVAAPYLLPYVWSMVQYGADAAQNKFLNHWLMAVRSSVLDGVNYRSFFSILGLVIAGLLVPYRRGLALLLLLLVAEVAYIMLSAAGIKFSVFLLHFKSFYLFDYLLALTPLIGFVALMQAGPRVGLTPVAQRGLGIGGLVLLSAVLLRYEVVPDAERAALPAQATPPTEMLAAFDRMTGGDYAHKIVMTNNYHLYSYRPVFCFVVYGAHYTHPAAQHSRRVRYLFQLEDVQHPNLFALGLVNNPFDTIDYVFDDHPEHLTYRSYYEGIQEIGRMISLRPERLTAPFIHAQAEGPYRLYRLDRAANPLFGMTADHTTHTPTQTLLATALRLLLEDFPYEVDEGRTVSAWSSATETDRARLRSALGQSAAAGQYPALVATAGL